MYKICIYLCTRGFTDDALKFTDSPPQNVQALDIVKDNGWKCLSRRLVFVYWIEKELNGYKIANKENIIKMIEII